MVAPDGESFLIEPDAAGTGIRVSKTNINVIAAAASLSVGLGSTAGVAVSGAGAVAQNVILTTTDAYIKESRIDSDGNVTLDARSESEINASVVALSAAVGGGGTAGIGASLGIAVSQNYIGFTPDGGAPGAAVRAYVDNSKITANGNLVHTAIAAQEINALVISGSAAVAVGGTAGVAASGSGVVAENKIGVDVLALIDGDGANVADDGIRAASVSLMATDTSTIFAFAGAASLAASFGGTVGGSLSIGVSLATNVISTDVAASIRRAEVTTAPSGNVTVNASETATIKAFSGAASAALGFSGVVSVGISGAGAEATNVILTDTNAFIEDSQLVTVGDVDISAENRSTIDAQIISASFALSIGGTVGIGASIGASFARNLIGFKANGVRDGAEVQAYIKNSSIADGAALGIDAISDQTIVAEVLAGSAAVAGGTVGVAVSGAGVTAENKMGADVRAYIDGDGTGIAVDRLSIMAVDRSRITAEAGAAAVAASFGVAGASVAIGFASAENEINNNVNAYINSADNLQTTVGGIIVGADETSRITALTETATVSLSVSIGLSASAGVTQARNILGSTVSAYVRQSDDVRSEGAVQITANDTATIRSEVLSVSAAGGLVSLAFGLGLSDNLIEDVVSAFVETSDITAKGNIDVTADSRPTIVTSNTVGAVSIGLGVSVAGGSSENTIEGVTEAFIGSSNLTALGRDVLVKATSQATAAPVIEGLSGGLLAVGAMASDVNIAGTTQAYASGRSSVSANKFDIMADDTSVARPVTIIDSAGAIAITASDSNVEISRETRADIRSGTDITMATGGTLNVTARSTADAVSATSSVTVSAFTIGLLNVKSKVNNKTRATIGRRATVRATRGAVTVSAPADNRADARIESFGVGIGLSASVSEPVAEVVGETRAVVLGNVIGAQPGETVANLVVLAESTDETVAGSDATGGGAISLSSSDVRATTKPTVYAEIGGVIQSGGSVTVQAISNTDADASSKSSSGGLVDIPTLDAAAVSEPAVDANVTPGATIAAGTTLTIRATHGGVPAVFSDGTFDAAVGVNRADNAIGFSAAHGLLTGDQVTYDAQDEAVVGGLADGRQYRVIQTATPSRLKLGATFSSFDRTDPPMPMVDIDRDVLQFSVPHNLQDGDDVLYDAVDGNVVGGLTSGQSYEVKRIDDTTLKLIDPSTPPSAPIEVRGADVNGNTITGQGFTAGQAVTYRAPQASTFTVGAVGADSKIRLGAGHGLATGDEVIYTAEDSVLEPLTDAIPRYFVILDAADPEFIQLARTLDEAIGNAGAGIPVTPILLAPSTDANDQFDVHTIRKVANQPIGLVDGLTYYVVNADADSFELATDPDGLNIVTPDPLDPVTGEVLTGTGTLGTEGIDLRTAGTGRHQLVLELTSGGNGLQRLDGIGGARALAAAPSGDGVVTAAASGSGGGLVSVGSATTSATSEPTVNTDIGNRAVLSAFDIVLDAAAYANASASSANSGGGAVAVGEAMSSNTVTSTAILSVGQAAQLTAEQTMALTSRTFENASVLADSGSVGLAGVGDATASSTSQYTSRVDIGSNALLTAGTSLLAESQSQLSSTAEATVDAGGLGASSNTSSSVDVGKGNDPATTETRVGSGAVLQSDSVEVLATVTPLIVRSRATANSTALGADADALAEADVVNTALVTLLDDAVLTGDTVTIVSRFDDIDLRAITVADCDCGIGSANATSNVTYDSKAEVSAELGAKVSAIDVDVQAIQEVNRYDRRATSDVAAIGSDNSTESGSFQPRRVIDWNADVALLSGIDTSTPVLSVDANGSIVRATGVTVNGGSMEGGTIAAGAAAVSIDPIINDGSAAGSASFFANSDVGNASALDNASVPDGRIEGGVRANGDFLGGTISAASAFRRIDIQNDYDLPLVLNDIDVATLNALPDVSLDADDITVEFDIVNEVPPRTEIIVINNTAQDVRIAGQINNPIGITEIVTRGDLLTEGAGVLRSNQLDLTASNGAIGSSVDPIDIQLVRTDWGPTTFNAEAGQDIDLDLSGLLRDTELSRSTFDIGSVVAGGDVNIVLQTAVQQIVPLPGTSNNGVNVEIVDGLPPQPNKFRAHFRPDASPLPDIPLDPRVFADLTQSPPIDGAYDFDEIVGQNITVNAAQPAATEPLVHFASFTDVGDTGDIFVLTNGNIGVTETDGDLRIESVTSNAGDVHLATILSPNASILEVIADDGATPYVIGNSIALSATGGIGRVDDFLEIDSSNRTDGVVQASAGDGLFLKETQGDLRLDSVVSRESDVVLITLAGSILDALDDEQADVQGANIDIDVTGGSIGSADNAVEFYGAGPNQEFTQFAVDTLAVPAAGRLFAVADNSVFLGEMNGAVDVLKVAAAAGDARLTIFDTVRVDEYFNLLATGGQSLTGEPVPRGRFTASGNVAIIAADDVDVPLGTSVTGGGSVIIRGDKIHTLDPSAGQAAFAAVRNGTTLEADAVFDLVYDGQAIPVTVSAGEFLDDGALLQHIQDAVDGAIQAAGFGNPGDVVAVSGLLGEVVLATFDPDLQTGSTISLAGEVAAPSVRISGGNNLDFIQILDPNGINPTGVTVLDGSFGDDRFFVPAVPSPLTVNAGAGADRLYFAENASKALFGGDLFDDDNLDPFDVLTGTLENIEAPLTVNTGTAGPGGTRDGIYFTAGDANIGLTGVLAVDSITGLDMTGDVTFTTDEGAFLFLELGRGDDTLRVTGVDANVVAIVRGAEGSDTVNAGNNDDPSNVHLQDVDGILGFFGEDGADDTLNVFGNGTSSPGQLTAIGVTGLGMGRNNLVATHNDVFGANFDINAADFPGAIYYGSREASSIETTVEHINVQLGTGDDVFNIDSVYDYGSTVVRGGAGQDRIKVGSTASGLHPDLVQRVDFVDGDLKVMGEAGPDEIIVDDSGDLTQNTGIYQGATVRGLDMAGSIEFDPVGHTLDLADEAAAAIAAVRTGSDLNAGVTFAITYDGMKVDVSVAAGTFGSDEALRAHIQTTVDQAVTGAGAGSDGDIAVRVDSIGAIVMSLDTIEIRLGDQDDTFYVPATSAGRSATLKTGNGFDTVYVGTVPGAETTGSLDGIQASFAIQGGAPEANDTLFINDQDNAADSTYTVDNAMTGIRILQSGIPWPVDTTTVTRTLAAPIRYQTMETVVLNAGQGSDTIRLHGTHREQDVTEGHFATFTVNAGGGDDTINVGKPVGSLFTLDDFAIDTDPPTFGSPKGIPVLINGQDGTDAIHLRDSASSEDTNLAFVQKEFAELFPSSTPGVASQEFRDLFTRILGEDPELTPYATTTISRQGEVAPLNISARTSEGLNVSLGSGADVVEIADGDVPYDITVFAGGGDDTFNVNNGVRTLGRSVIFNGETGDDLAFARFEQGVPSETVDFTFRGGPHASQGDKLRIAGDGVTTGGVYRPSSTIAAAGNVSVGGSSIDFSGVEPLVVHGLPDFQLIGTDDAADFVVNSVNVADLNLSSLILHVVTLDGAVTWTPETKLIIDDASRPKHVGQSMAISDDGGTLVVGADLQNVAYGVVFIYKWKTDTWVESAKLYPSDRGIAGEGFGEAVAISGNSLVIVGAPADATDGDDSGAAYVFALGADGEWSQQAKLRADVPSANDRFGASVDVDGTTAVVGAPGAHDAFVFSRDGATWVEQTKIDKASGNFGYAVAIAGNRLAVGQPNAGAGAVVTYSRAGAGWGQDAVQRIAPADPQANEQFGASL
ncbi:MAG: hypothetical protein ACC645_01580, partial [Pirellulales bacterium]